MTTTSHRFNRLRRLKAKHRLHRPPTDLFSLNSLLLLLLLIPPVAFMTWVMANSVNFPFFDDYYWYNRGLASFYQKTYASLPALLFQQNNDHRLPLVRALPILVTLIGPFDYRLPILLTNLLLVSVYFHLLYSLRRAGIRFVYLLPVGPLLLTVVPYTTIFGYGITTYAVLLFAYYTFVFTTAPDSVRNRLAMLAFLIQAILSNSNGFLVGGLVFAYQLMKGRIRFAFTLLGFLALGAFLYLTIDYQYGWGHQHNSSLENRPSITLLFFLRFLGYVGMTSSDWAGLVPAVVIGTAVVASTLTGAYLLLKAEYVAYRQAPSGFLNRPQPQPSAPAQSTAEGLTLLLLFITATGFILSLKRFTGKTSDLLTIIPHYSQYSVLAITATYCFWLLIQPKRRGWLAGVMVPASLCFSAVTHLTRMPALEDYLGQLRADEMNFAQTGSVLHFAPVQGLEESVRRVNELKMLAQHKLFQPSRTPVSFQNAVWKDTLPANLTLKENSLRIILHQLPRAHFYEHSYVVLSSGRQYYFLPLLRANQSLQTIFKTRSLTGGLGVTYLYSKISRQLLPSNTYHLFVWYRDKHYCYPLTETVMLSANSLRIIQKSAGRRVNP